MLTIEKKSLKVGKYVDTNHVNSVITNYKQTRWVHNSERIGKPDSLSVWFSIEEVEEFLNEAKLHGANGVRFYFAAYPHDYSDPIGADRQTIVMVASKKKETAEGQVSKDVYINTDKGSTILAYNQGQYCPPFNCPKGGGPNPEIGVTIIDQGEKGMSVI
jgi:hypothetical protein